MPEPLFERLYRETTTMHWQPTEVIRRQGDRRAARQRLTIAGTAFVAVLLLASAAVLAWRPGGGPTDVGVPTSAPAPSSTTTTSSTGPPATSAVGTSPPPVEVLTVPKAAMLQPVDTDNATLNPDRPRGDWSLGWLLGTCPAGPAGFGPTSVSSDGRSFEYADGRSVLQSVDAYATGDAQRAFAWFRGKITACPTIEYGGTASSVRVRAESFGGNESLLVETETREGTTLFIVVRAGNLMTEILAARFDQAGARALGQRAAARLCPLTRTC